MVKFSNSIYNEQYFGFVYIWFDRKHKRYYIGSHMGSIDDGYICSSQWMKRGYSIRPHDFKRRILYLHPNKTRKELLKEEEKWLQLASKKSKKRYYNRKFHCFGKEIEEIRANTKKSWTPERKEAWTKKMQEWREKDLMYKEKLSSCKSHSEETKAKMKESRNKREPTSDETRVKMSKSAKERDQGSKNVELHKQKKIGMHGKKHSEETKRKMSENSRWNNPTL